MMSVLEILHPGTSELRGRGEFFGEVTRTHLFEEQQHGMRGVELAAPVFLAEPVACAICPPEHGHVDRAEVFENLHIPDTRERFDVASLGVSEKEYVVWLSVPRGVRSSGEPYFNPFLAEKEFVECRTSDVGNMELGCWHGEKPSIPRERGECVTKCAGS